MESFIAPNYWYISYYYFINNYSMIDRLINLFAVAWVK